MHGLDGWGRATVPGYSTQPSMLLIYEGILTVPPYIKINIAKRKTLGMSSEEIELIAYAALFRLLLNCSAISPFFTI